jgi:hypothetical protein
VGTEIKPRWLSIWVCEYNPSDNPTCTLLRYFSSFKAALFYPTIYYLLRATLAMCDLPSLLGYFDSADEALHACVRDNDLQKLQQLLRALPLPNVNYSHQAFGPPVHFAAWCGDLEAVELLLDAGAYPFPSSYSEPNLTAMGFAASKGHRDVVKRLWTICPP